MNIILFYSDYLIRCYFDLRKETIKNNYKNNNIGVLYVFELFFYFTLFVAKHN